MEEIGKSNPEISKVSVDFYQEGNTLGTTHEDETINISLEFQLGEKDGAFVVIKTEGWSMDDAAELNQLVERVKQILKKDDHEKRQKGKNQ